MTLHSGTRLGPYEILAPLGAGGMGEVYRARDSKLGREVAVKVLPEDFAQDEGRLARFEREARVLASLNHPHVATLHGFEQEGETRYLVMELVEGEDLARRLKRGPLPLREALPLFLQVAEGLEAAHERGIIHRDLKPANVKVTEEGTVKVLDFGLAKAVQPAAVSVDDDLSQSPTLSATHHGEILGTAAYMSPEQAQGKAVDKRTDIWAFGCCLYETLTGARVFQADTAPRTLAKILERDPRWEALPGKTPERIQELLLRCLEKDPRQRLHDIADARIEIAAALDEPAGVAAPVGDVGWATRWRWGLGGAVITAAVMASLIALFFRQPAGSVGPVGAGVVRTTIQLPGDAPIVSNPYGNFTSFAVSQDGSKIVYLADRGDTTQLYLRRLDRFEVTPIPGTSDSRHFALSPDGREVAFVADDYLQRVSLAGGEPKALCEARSVYGVTWADDQSIYFTRHELELVRVPADGGEPERLTYPVTNPFALPGDAGVLVTDWQGTPSWRADFLSIAHVSPDGRFKTLLEGGYKPRYLSTGHLVFVRGDRLHAAAFDLERLEVTGPALPVVDGVWTDSVFSNSLFSASSNGTLVYAAGGDWTRTIPTWIDRDGNEEPLSLPAQVYQSFSLSPDGRRLALHVTGPTDQIYIHDLERKTLTRLTLEASNGCPLWTADGKRVVFLRWSTAIEDPTLSRAVSRYELYWQPVDGSGEAERLVSPGDLQATEAESYFTPASVSPDGTSLAFWHDDPTGRGDIWLLPLGGDGHARPLIATDSFESGAFFSPDGRWIAFSSDKTGRNEIFVRPFPAGDREWQASNDGGGHPLWSPRGDELFYRDGMRLMVVPVSTTPEFRAGTPRVLFERDDFGVLGFMSYQVSPDGQRILIGKSLIGAKPVTELRVVLNWFEELKEKMREARR